MVTDGYSTIPMSTISRKRPDGLDVNGMPKGPSKRARKMRTVLIEKEEGILGNYDHPKRLKVDIR